MIDGYHQDRLQDGETEVTRWGYTWTSDGAGTWDDDRIDFVGGIRGLQELSRRVDSGEMAVAFSLYPTGLDDLMAVADIGKVMPPKSTWFEPKLADGLISHMLS